MGTESDLSIDVPLLEVSQEFTLQMCVQLYVPLFYIPCRQCSGFKRLKESQQRMPSTTHTSTQQSSKRQRRGRRRGRRRRRRRRKKGIILLTPLPTPPRAKLARISISLTLPIPAFSMIRALPSTLSDSTAQTNYIHVCMCNNNSKKYAMHN